MLNFAEQTGSGAVMIVWSFLSHTHALRIPVLSACGTKPTIFIKHNTTDTRHLAGSGGRRGRGSPARSVTSTFLPLTDTFGGPYLWFFGYSKIYVDPAEREKPPQFHMGDRCTSCRHTILGWNYRCLFLSQKSPQFDMGRRCGTCSPHVFRVKGR